MWRYHLLQQRGRSVSTQPQVRANECGDTTCFSSVVGRFQPSPRCARMNVEIPPALAAWSVSFNLGPGCAQMNVEIPPALAAWSVSFNLAEFHLNHGRDGSASS